VGLQVWGIQHIAQDPSGGSHLPYSGEAAWVGVGVGMTGLEVKEGEDDWLPQPPL
jgi:hypothetical protein